MASEKTGRGPVIGITLDIEEEHLCLKQNYPLSVRNAGGVPLLIPHSNDPCIVAEIIDGLLLPGGGDIEPAFYSEGPLLIEAEEREHKAVSRERTEFEIALLRAIMELRKPVLGICYGMQLINVALGGSLYQDIGIQFGIAIDHRKGSHGILGRGDLVSGEAVVNSSHHQAVKQLGSGLSACAFSDDRLVEGFELTGYPFLVGIQWHPERSNDALSGTIMRSFVEASRAH